jgi:biotin carboxyl carrier protein
MKFFVRIDGKRLQVEVSNGTVRVEGEAVDVELSPTTLSPVRGVRAGSRSLRLIPRRNGRGDWSVELEGVRWRAEVLDPGQEAIRAARKAAGVSSGPPPLKAPMPGLVVRIEVSEGDEVTAGQGLVIVEAMKMENELRAPAPGRVKAVRVTEGTAVEKDAVLIEFEPRETTGEGTEEGE